MKLEVFANYEFMVSLQRLLGQKMPVRLGYRLKTIRTAIVAEFEKYEEMRKELIIQYAEKDETGEVKTQPNSQNVVFTGGNEKLFSNKIKELQQIEFQVPAKVKLSEIESFSDLTGQDIVNLSDIIEE